MTSVDENLKDQIWYSLQKLPELFCYTNISNLTSYTVNIVGKNGP